MTVDNPTPAEREAVDAVSRLGQEHPTPPELTAAEQAAAAAIRDIGSWEYCNDEPDPRMAYREWLARLSRDVVAKVRPHLYREAADAVEQMPHELGDDGWAALGHRAENAGWPAESLRRLRNRRDTFANMTVEAAYQHGYREAARILRAAGLEGRGDDH